MSTTWPRPEPVGIATAAESPGASGADAWPEALGWLDVGAIAPAMLSGATADMSGVDIDRHPCVVLCEPGALIHALRRIGFARRVDAAGALGLRIVARLRIEPRLIGAERRKLRAGGADRLRLRRLHGFRGRVVDRQL